MAPGKAKPIEQNPLEIRQVPGSWQWKCRATLNNNEVVRLVDAFVDRNRAVLEAG